MNSKTVRNHIEITCRGADVLPLDLIEEFQGTLKKRTKRDIERIIKSILTYGFSFPFFVWPYNGRNYCLDGHGRIQALREMSNQGIPLPSFPVAYIDAADEQEAKQKLLRLNSQYGQMTLESVLRFVEGLDVTWEDLALPDGFLSIDKGAGASPAGTTPTLADKFLIPPFSVLNARSGWWQERKRSWLSMGIKSEEGGREKLKSSGSLSGTVPGYYDRKKKCEADIGRELSNKEFEAEYLQDYLPRDSTLAHTETGGILSIFDPVLCEIAYRWFCPPSGLVLDPFSGGSVRGIVASKLGFRYVGQDLRAEQIEANQAQAVQICSEPMPRWIVGDSLHIDQTCQGIEADFIFSCPPYADLEVYSDDPADLSTMDYPAFRQAYSEIIKKACSFLRQDRFACFVVGEVRDKKGKYYNFVSDTIQAFLDGGLSYYNEAILVTALGSLPIRVAKQFTTARKLGKTHQNVLVFVKGDGKKAANECGIVEVDDAILAHEGGEID